MRREVPAYIRSDNAPEFTANKVRDWLKRLNAKTLFIEPARPWENGYNESFNGTLRYELLDMHWFDTLLEAKVQSNSGEWNTTRSALTVHWNTVPRPRKRSIRGPTNQQWL